MKNFYLTSAVICLIAAAAGFAVWFALHFFTLNNVQWMLTFILFPMVIAWYANVLRFYRHPEKMHK